MFEYVESVCMEGPLEKKGRFKTWSWTKYWFVLDEDQLCYYRDSHRNSAQGLIDLGQAESVRIVQNISHGFPFEIVMKLDDKCHVLSAGNREDQNRWVKKLQHAMMLSWRRSMSMQRPSCDSLSEDEDWIQSFNKMLLNAGGDGNKGDDDVFNNNSSSTSPQQQRSTAFHQQQRQRKARGSKFPHYRTRVGSSEDELDDKKPDRKRAKSPAGYLSAQLSSAHLSENKAATLGREKTDKQSPPQVPNKPGRLSASVVAIGVKSPGPKSPVLTELKFPGVKISEPKSPGPQSPGAIGKTPPTPPDKKKPPPVSPKPKSKGPPLSPKPKGKEPSVSPKPKTRDPPVSPKPRSRDIYVSNKSTVTPRAAFAAKPPVVARKSAPLTEVGQMSVVKDLAERKRSSSLSAAQEGQNKSQLAQVGEICKENSIITVGGGDTAIGAKNGISSAERKNSGNSSPDAIVTYPLSILRKTPVRTEALKSCSDLMDVVVVTPEVESPDGSVLDLETLSLGSSSDYIARDSAVLESDMMKQFKKSQFMIDEDDASRDSLTSRETLTSSVQNGVSRFSKNPTATAAKSPVEAVKSKQKVGLRRSNAQRTKTPPSPTIIRRMQHKSYDPHAMRAAENASGSGGGMWTRHSEALTNSYAAEDDEESSDSDCANEYEAIWNYMTSSTPHDDHVPQDMTLKKDDLNFDFPPIPAMPNPRLEMRFDSPFDLIRRFLATNRGPNEIFPVPRKSERGGKAMSKLKLILRKLDPPPNA